MWIVEDSAGGRWSAVADGGTGGVSEATADDPEELIAWGRARADTVWIRQYVGGVFWAGDGDPPPDVKDDPHYEGVWPPAPDWQPRPDVSVEVCEPGGFTASCSCGWTLSGDDWSQGERAVAAHRAAHGW